MCLLKIILKTHLLQNDKDIRLQKASINKTVVHGGRQKSRGVQERCRTVEEQIEELSLGKESVVSEDIGR